MCENVIIAGERHGVDNALIPKRVHDPLTVVNSSIAGSDRFYNSLQTE